MRFGCTARDGCHAEIAKIRATHHKRALGRVSSLANGADKLAAHAVVEGAGAG